MKTNILIFLFISACQVELQASDKDSIIRFLNGKWNWVRTINYNGGTDYGPNDIDITQYYVFFQDGDDSLMQLLSYENYHNDTLMFGGKTSLSKTLVFGDSIWKLDSIYFAFQHFRIINYDSIIFSCGTCLDGSFVFYIRSFPLSVIENNNDSNFSFVIFPNPAKCQITITGYVLPATIRIYDITGKTLLAKTLASHYENISIEKLPAGMYVYELGSDNNVQRGKFIVEK